MMCFKGSPNKTKRSFNWSNSGKNLRKKEIVSQNETISLLGHSEHYLYVLQVNGAVSEAADV